MTDKILVYSTCESLDDANRIAEAVLGRRLAACVNILPGVQSIYHWKGKLERSEEFFLIIKSTRKCFEQLREVLSHVHTYEVPEVIAVPVVAGAESYLDWIDREMKTPEEEG
jgi:periplasmic divalent cation tolerance protein